MRPELSGVIRRLGRSAVRRLRRARRNARSVRDYPTYFTVPAQPVEPDGAWPDPPAIDSPAAGLVDPESEPTARSFDVALFEKLNAEYKSQPIVTNPPKYDMPSMVDRSRSRVSRVHRRIGLIDKTVLEIGCGSGLETWYAAHRFGADAWGIDVRPRRAWPALEGQRVHLIAGDIGRSSGLPDGLFDRVFSNTVWEHIEHPRAAFEQTYRVMKPGAYAWIRANLYRGPTASHLARQIYFPFPHLLFHDDVIAEGLRRAGNTPRGAAWVNRLTWEQYEAIIRETGFTIRSLLFDNHLLDEAFYARFEDVLGRYPRRDLERGFFTVILQKPTR